MLGTSSCSALTLIAATCSKILCSTNQRVKDNACISCLAGTTNADGGDDESGIGTTCDDIICSLSEYDSSNACKLALPERRRRRHHLGDDTVCDKTLFAADQHVILNTCIACNDNFNLPRDDASGGDTVCDGDLRASYQPVERNTSVACAPGTTNQASNDALRGDAECDVTYCAVDQRVKDYQCVTCRRGCPTQTAETTLPA